MSDNNRLGKLIGTIDHVFSMRLDKSSTDKFNLSVKFDFSTSTDQEIRVWLASNRTIALQKPLRAMTPSKITAINKTTIMANTAGNSIVDPMEQLDKITNGMTPEQMLSYALELQAKASK